jgi:7-cyano-7-deazaguanine synthase
MTAPRAIVLLSGGLDSATVLAIAREQGFESYALSFRYGQRHAIELDAAREVARRLGAARHILADLDVHAFSGSALAGEVPVPKGRSLAEMSTGIPVTYVPARNTIFLAYALAWAEQLDAADIFLGVNALDYSGYPDCRPEYIQAFERLANLATKAGVEGRLRFRIHAPLIDLTKRQIVARGRALGVPFEVTRSCYDPSPAGEGCGQCDACLLRLKGFEENGMLDPAPYRTGVRHRVAGVGGAGTPDPQHPTPDT